MDMDMDMGRWGGMGWGLVKLCRLGRKVEAGESRFRL
jgi:hypothetical protein